MKKGDIQIYKTSTGAEIQVNLDNETVWLDAHLIALLFDVQRPAIVKHIKNIYKSGELSANSTCSISEQVASDGKKRKMNLYNLDVIISVGYRVNSTKATQSRIWATQRLKEILVQGYSINQKRLDELQQTIHLIQKSIGEDTNLKEATELFGNEKDNSFEGTLQSVVQTFGGQYLYSSIEEQAAHLLYFIIKNHPFTDGNKRSCCKYC